MGMLRLFVPGSHKRQFHLDSQAPTTANVLYPVPSQMSINMKYSMTHYVKRFLRPKEFCAELLGIAD